MRIDRRNRPSVHKDQLHVHLTEAACTTGVKGRVCGACGVRCPRCGSMGCQCVCVSSCPEAPRALSSDPEGFPIEPAIVPLVFEMKRLGMFTPCWSCEGHALPDGSLSKPPRVWFYCSSLVQVRVFANGLASLKFSGKLHAPWHIVVTFSDPGNPDTAFSVEPALPANAQVKLAELQDDAATIARSLQALMNGEANRLLENISTSRPALKSRRSRKA